MSVLQNPLQSRRGGIEFWGTLFVGGALQTSRVEGGLVPGCLDYFIASVPALFPGGVGQAGYFSAVSLLRWRCPLLHMQLLSVLDAGLEMSLALLRKPEFYFLSVKLNDKGKIISFWYF